VAEFSPDGRRLATESAGGVVRLWETDSGQALSMTPLRHGAWISVVRFAPDGQRLATVADYGVVRMWHVPEGERADARMLAALVEVLSGERVNDFGAAVPIDDHIAAIAAARRDVPRPADRSIAAVVRGWVLGDRRSRAIGPFTTTTIDDYVKRQAASERAIDRAEARRLFPWDARLRPSPDGGMQ
jgi:hypothetical protein